MGKRSPLRQEYHAKASGGTYDYVKSDVVPTGKIWHVTELAYENETGARGTFRRYLERPGSAHMIAELQGPGAAELIFSNNELLILPGERLTIRQATCTAADVLSLYLTGFVTVGPYVDGEE
jgi:hypothetical protein